jgi:hypothetical protein
LNTIPFEHNNTTTQNKPHQKTQTPSLPTTTIARIQGKEREGKEGKDRQKERIVQDRTNQTGLSFCASLSL